jgi:hypothetical protein
MNGHRIRRTQADHEARIRQAIDFQNKASQIQSDASVKVGEEKVQFFEKLAFGCGAAIAAIVSFVGSSPMAIQRPDPLRWSVALLAGAFAAAMYRNWRYPFYIVSVWTRHKAEADRQVDSCEAEMFEDYPAMAAVDENGSVIPPEKYRTDYVERMQLRDEAIRKAIRHENWVFGEVKISEIASCILAVLAGFLLTLVIVVNLGFRGPTATPDSKQPKLSKGSGERAGARTQDQRLKRAMLYQLSYPLAPHLR